MANKPSNSLNNIHHINQTKYLKYKNNSNNNIKEEKKINKIRTNEPTTIITKELSFLFSQIFFNKQYRMVVMVIFALAKFVHT